MDAIGRSSLRASMVVCLFVVLLMGCLASPQNAPVEIIKPVIPTSTLNKILTLPPPATPGPGLKSPTSSQPTPTRTPTSLPAGEITLPYNLLYLSDDRLMHWSHLQNAARPVVIDVVDYSASQDGSKIAVLRRNGITANAVESFDLTVINTGNGNFVTLLDGIPRPSVFQISPDGLWIALMNELKQLYILPTDGSTTGVKISDCQSSQPGSCDELAWSADNQSVIWDDGEGIWHAGPGNQLPSLVISNQLDIPDPEGQLIRKQVIFHGLYGSPLGRYILTRIQPVGSDVSWQAIVDSRLKRLAGIPATYQVNEPTALALWLTNGNLLVIHRGPEPGNRSATFESWQILPTREDLLSLDFRWQIPGDRLASIGITDQWSALPAAAYQLNDRVLAIAWNSSGSGGSSGYFTLDTKYGLLDKNVDLPVDVVKIAWTPAGDAALVVGSDGTVVYFTTDNTNVTGLTARFGRQTCCYKWLVDGTAWP